MLNEERDGKRGWWQTASMCVCVCVCGLNSRFEVINGKLIRNWREVRWYILYVIPCLENIVCSWVCFSLKCLVHRRDVYKKSFKGKKRGNAISAHRQTPVSAPFSWKRKPIVYCIGKAFSGISCFTHTQSSDLLICLHAWALRYKNRGQWRDSHLRLLRQVCWMMMRLCMWTSFWWCVFAKPKSYIITMPDSVYPPLPPPFFFSVTKQIADLGSSNRNPIWVTTKASNVTGEDGGFNGISTKTSGIL